MKQSLTELFDFNMLLIHLALSTYSCTKQRKLKKTWEHTD